MFCPVPLSSFVGHLTIEDTGLASSSKRSVRGNQLLKPTGVGYYFTNCTKPLSLHGIGAMASSLRPPINRAMKSLDRAFFSLTVPISAARVFQNQCLSKLRSQLLKTSDLTEIDRLSPIARDPEPELAAAGRKCLLLRSDLKHNGRKIYKFSNMMYNFR
jgi:hypothetical protein